MDENGKRQEHEGEEVAAGLQVHGIVKALAELPLATIVTEEALTAIFDRHSVSVKRAVHRGELPPPTRLFGKPVWTVGAILQHIEKRLEAAKKEAEQATRKISELSA